MLEIQGYKVLSLVDENAFRFIYMAYDDESRKNVFLIKYKIKYSNLYKSTENFVKDSIPDIDGILKFEKIIQNSEDSIIKVDFFDGITLSKYLQINTFISLSDFFKIAINLLKVIADTHSQNIIYKYLNADNIFINSENFSIKIIDPNIIKKSIDINNSNLKNYVLMNLLTYISPEILARTTGKIDFSTDFYSIGILFYRILAGKLPFKSNDVIELIHCHLAKLPDSLYSINEFIPEVLSNLVLKLISKNPQDRYRNVYGIIHDLNKCRFEWNEKAAIDNFKLGVMDDISDFKISKKLYGRENEIDKILNLYTNARNFSSQMVFVYGQDGIGKTKFLSEVKKQLSQMGSIVMRGECDEKSITIPYYPVLNAIKGLVYDLLMSNEEQIKYYRNELIKSIGSNIGLITELVPEIEFIIGKQQLVQNLTPDDAQNRFFLAFEEFITVFAKSRGPLIFIIDDAQWMDSESINILKHSFLNLYDLNVMVICSYNSSTNNKNSFKGFLNNLTSNSIPVTKIELKSWKISSIISLISDTLFCSKEDCDELAKLIAYKSQGNPFDMKLILNEIYNKKYIKYDYKNNTWNWNLEDIVNIDVSSGTLDLIVNKFHKLPSSTTQALKYAASLCDVFDINIVSMAMGITFQNTLKILKLAVDEGIIIPLNKYIDINKNNENKIEFDESCINYRFVHNKVYQSIYVSISNNEKERIHLNLGQALLKNTREDMINESIYSIVNHFNQAINLIEDESEKYNLAVLNLKAAKRSKTSAAYKYSLECLNTAWELISDFGWQKYYETAFEINIQRYECEFLNGNSHNTENLFSYIFINTKNIDEKIQLYNGKISILTSQGKYKKAIDTGLEGLNLLGYKVLNKISFFEIFKEGLKVENQLRLANINDIYNYKIMKDKRQLNIMELLSSICLPAFILDKKTYIYYTLKNVNYNLKYGNNAFSPNTYLDYAIVLNMVFKQYKCGEDYAMMALKMATHNGEPKMISKALTILGSLILIWTRDYNTQLQYLDRSFKISIDSGEILFSCLSANCIVSVNFLKGENLYKVVEICNKYLSYVKRIRANEAISSISLVKHVALNLMGKTKSKFSLETKDFSEENYIKILSDMNTVGFYIYKQMVLYIFGSYKNAYLFSKAAEEECEALSNYSINYIYRVFDSLSMASYYSLCKENDKHKLISKINKNLSIIKKWMYSSNSNFECGYLLVKAELGRITNNKNTYELYDEAIKSAINNEQIHFTAIATELAYKYNFGIGKLNLSKYYLINSINYYKQWGAELKSVILKQKLKEIFDYSYNNNENNAEKKEVQLTNESAFTLDEENLSLSALIKSSQAITNEVGLPNLLNILIKNLILNSGAQRCCIIIKEKNKFYVEADETSEEEYQFNVKSELSKYEKVPQSIINYTVNMKKEIIIKNSVKEEKFSLDPYIIKNKPGSILSIPIMNNNEILGIVYLENKLLFNVFSERKISLVKLLASEAAISIRNIIIYSEIKSLNNELEKKVEIRTTELQNTIGKLQTENFERKRVEEKLYKNKIQMNSLINSIPDFIGLQDGEGKWITLNDSAKKILNLSDDNYKNKSDEALMDGNITCRNLLPYFIKSNELTWNMGNTYKYKQIIHTFGSEEQIFEMTKVPVFDNEKNRKSLIIIGKDITDRENAIAELLENEKRYHSIVELCPEAIFIHDKGKIEYVNPAGLKLLGEKNYNEVIGHSILCFTPKEEHEALKKNINFTKYRLYDFKTREQTIINESGEKVDVQVSSSVIYYKNKLMQFEIILDISSYSKQKELSNMVEAQKKQLEDTYINEKLRNDFFANISHELRTPLNVIFASEQMLELYLKEGNENNLKLSQKYITTMKQNCFRLVRLINNLIDITKIDAGYFELSLKNCNIVNIVEEITLSVAQYIEGKGLSLIFDTEAEEKIIACDADKIERIILNLLSNSLKFTDAGGEIKVNIYDNNDSVSIVVQDNGVGIPKHKQELIFERFVQVDKSFSRNKEGSGIGLAIVKSLVELHNGTIRLESEEGKGSKFIITLPSTRIDENLHSIEKYSSLNEENKIEKINIEFSDIYS